LKIFIVNHKFMPLKPTTRKRFFTLVEAVQTGKVSPKKVGSRISEAAKNLSPKDVSYLKDHKDIPSDKITEVVCILRNINELIREDATLMGQNSSDSERNPIAKTFNQKGNFEEYIQQFSGLEMKPKELEAVSNHVNSKPTKMDKFFVRYESSDDFSNSTTTVIKKLREGNDLVFTVFQTSTQQAGPESNPQPSAGSDIIVNKSVAFRNEIDGGNILADLLQKLEV
jgi:hypothetical protein